MPGRRSARIVGIEVVEVQVDVVLLRADAAALADLDRHAARDDVARGEILEVRRIALHEALAVGVGEIAAFAARAFGDQHAGAVDAGRVELHELHVLQRQAGAQHHGVAVAGAGVGRGAGEVGAAVAAGRQDRLLGAEAVQRAVLQAQRDDAAAGALAVHDQVDGEVLDEELGRVAQRLAIERVQHGVAGAVGGGAGALRGRAFAELGGHAAERALVDAAVLGAGERHAVVLELVDGLDGVAAEVLDGVLVAEPVGALDGVVHVPAPVVRAHVAERGGDAALGRDGVRAGREHLGDAGGLEAGLGGAERGAQARAAGADDDHVIGVVGERVGLAVDGGLGNAVARDLCHGCRFRSAVVGSLRMRVRSDSEAQFQQRAYGDRRRSAITKNVLSIRAGSCGLRRARSPR